MENVARVSFLRLLLLLLLLLLLPSLLLSSALFSLFREAAREIGGGRRRGIKGALLRMRCVEAPGDKRDCINRSRRIVPREISASAR